MPGSLSKMANRARRHLGSYDPKAPYLSYYDVRLYYQDIDSLRDGEWLSDAAIEFWQEYLEREELKSFPRAQIVLMRPQLSYLLRMTQSMDQTFLNNLPDFTQTTHVFLPINDNDDVDQAAGGSHWSLLLVSVIDGVCFHYDSLHAANEQVARQTTRKLEKVLKKELRFIPMDDAPQQDNSSDCGVFVCIAMKHLLLKRLLKADASEKISMSMRGQRINAHDGRKVMQKLIEDRKKEAERRESVSPLRSKRSNSREPPRISTENEGL